VVEATDRQAGVGAGAGRCFATAGFASAGFVSQAQRFVAASWRFEKAQSCFAATEQPAAEPAQSTTE